MARRRRRREDEEASYWLSYSDMMAGLLLMFVVIISFTMLQSRLQVEEDERVLREKQTVLEEQQETMAEQSEELKKQAAEIESTQKTLAEKEATVATQEKKLKEAEKTLATQQSELDKTKETLKGQQKELKGAEKTLAEQQKELDEAKETLAEQQTTLETREKELTAAQTQLAEQQKTLETQQGQIESQQKQMEEIVGVKKDLIQALRDAFAGTATVAVDSKTGAIMFESSILFDFNNSVLSEEGEDFLKEFLPEYFGVLLSDQFRDYISEIIIEGHTDTEGGYLFNLELSQQRALAVANVCLADDGGILDPETTEFLRGIVTANGRSYSNPIYAEDGSVDMDASRRVEFKFRLKDEEMVEQMMAILEQKS